MKWWTFGLGGKSLRVSPKTKTLIEKSSLTAAASDLQSATKTFLPSYESWQDEVWGYYDTLGEFHYAVDWKSRMMSRVRLFAARIDPNFDEPERLDDDSLAVQLVSSLGGAIGQPEILSDLSVQLDVVGEGFVIAETVGRIETWSIRSRDEIRKRSGQLEILDDQSIGNTREWRTLADDNFIMRVFQSHKRFHSMADSSARSARGTMREVELVNRHIISQYLSRLASAGIIIFPEEITFPVREEFADQPDPFMAEWIEIAAQAIQQPGTASAVIPVPMKVPGEWLGKIQHIDPTLKIDDNIIEKRESALKRLATQLNIPAEILTGMGAINHWGAWQLEEGALKTTIAPDAELICAALTEKYLRPRLAASGEENPNQFVVWYDMSELTIRPDRSSNAFQAYDRLELSGEALRRESGFNESDKPERIELEDQALKVILRTVADLAPSAFQDLTGVPLDSPQGTSGEPQESPQELADIPVERTEPEELSPSLDASAKRKDRLIHQSRARHVIYFDGLGGREVFHPPSICKSHVYSCPYTQASLSMKGRAFPSRSGLYNCLLDSFGDLKIGDLDPQIDLSDLVPTRSANGHRI